MISRRNLLAIATTVPLLAMLSKISFADGHGDTPGVAIAGETGVLDLLQNVSTLAGASTPNFFVAAIQVIVFAVTLGWLPMGGLP